MTADFINTCVMISFAFLIAAFFLVVWRLSKGPTIADRVLCLDMLTTIAIGFVIVVAIHTHRSAYLDVAIALGLVGFLATLAFARFILWRGTHSQKDQGEADG